MPAVAAAAKKSLEQASEDSEPIVARLPVTAISDRIAAMRIQEETNYRCRDYFLDPLLVTNKPLATAIAMIWILIIPPDRNIIIIPSPNPSMPTAGPRWQNGALR